MVRSFEREGNAQGLIVQRNTALAPRRVRRASPERDATANPRRSGSRGRFAWSSLSCVTSRSWVPDANAGVIAGTRVIGIVPDAEKSDAATTLAATAAA